MDLFKILRKKEGTSKPHLGMNKTTIANGVVVHYPKGFRVPETRKELFNAICQHVKRSFRQEVKSIYFMEDSHHRGKLKGITITFRGEQDGN